jgi:hypothetical protein
MFVINRGLGLSFAIVDFNRIDDGFEKKTIKGIIIKFDIALLE